MVWKLWKVSSYSCPQGIEHGGTADTTATSARDIMRLAHASSSDESILGPGDGRDESSRLGENENESCIDKMKRSLSPKKSSASVKPEDGILKHTMSEMSRNPDEMTRIYSTLRCISARHRIHFHFNFGTSRLLCALR